MITLKAPVHCTMCNELDDNQMVQCDDCDCWVHYKCAKVNPVKIASMPWSCEACVSQKPDLESTEVILQQRLDELAEKERKMVQSLKEQEEILKARKEELEKITEEQERAISEQILAREERLKEYEEKFTKTNATLNELESRLSVMNQASPVLRQLSARTNSNRADATNMDGFLARQTVDIKLPPFSGTPLEWPAFIAKYEYTTKQLKLRPYENLDRLQKSLREGKGEAYRLFADSLITPDSVDSVMASMKMLYGRPDSIINSQIEVIRKRPLPKEDKLQTLLHYSIDVSNLVSAIKASHVDAYLNDPRLIIGLGNVPAKVTKGRI